MCTVLKENVINELYKRTRLSLVVMILEDGCKSQPKVVVVKVTIINHNYVFIYMYIFIHTCFVRIHGLCLMVESIL